MSDKRFRTALLVVFLISIPWSGLLAAENPVGSQGKPAEDQKYAGTWSGAYTVDGGPSNNLSYTLSRDDKGQWRGTIKFNNQDGEQTGELRAIVIADAKFKAKLDSPDGQVEVTIEGVFKGDQFEGTYSVSPKGTTDVAEKGTWKVTKSATPKTGQ